MGQIVFFCSRYFEFNCYHDYKMHSKEVKTITHLKLRFVKKLVDQQNQLHIQVWFVGRVYKSCNFFW